MRKLRRNHDSVIPDQEQPVSKAPGLIRRLWLKKNHIGFWTLLLSLVIHLGLVAILPIILNDDPSITRAEALRMWLHKKPVAQAKDAPKVDKKTIIQITPTFKTERPQNADFLAEHDASAKEEKQRKPRKAAAPKPHATAPDDSKPASPQKPQALPEHALIGIKAKRHATKNDPLALRPEFTEQAAGDGPSEFIPDLKDSDETELNAWQWRHAPFFNRIKSRIGQVWSPQAQIARFDPQGVLLGKKDRITVLQVTIDRSGSLRELKVTDQSGVAYLDDEAERAFRAAAPFLYPPQELFADGDEFSFTFAFHLYIDRGFSFGFDWQKN